MTKGSHVWSVRPIFLLVLLAIFWYISAIVLEVFETFACIAQLVERSTDTRKVPGSNPGTRTKCPHFGRVSTVPAHCASRNRNLWKPKVFQRSQSLAAFLHGKP
jgi:hypothetical protein